MLPQTSEWERGEEQLTLLGLWGGATNLPRGPCSTEALKPCAEVAVEKPGFEVRFCQGFAVCS